MLSRVVLAAPAVLLMAARPAAAQLSVEPSGRYEMYGEPIDVELWDVAFSAGRYQKRNIRTGGTADWLEEPYLRLRDQGAEVVLIPTPGIEADLRSLLGRDVEVTGIVRELQRPRSDPCLLGHWSLCEDPNLPPLPDLTDSRGHWPRVSITVWSLTDMTEQRKKQRLEALTVTLEALLSRPGARDGQTVRVVGKFRGRNLYGDLPARSQRNSSDWVIKDEHYAVWVSGKKPKGEGFNLDPGLKRDTGKWVEVVGRVETRGGVTYLRAVKVGLATAPSPTAQVQPPPPPPERPKVPPVVVFSLPLDGEAEVPIDSRFVVQFNKDMNEETFRGHVLLRYSGPQLPGDRPFVGLRLSYDGGRRALTVDPGDRLLPGRQVELLLLPGIADIDGLELTPRPGRFHAGAVDVLRFFVGS
jgi:hypothetical protein